MQHIQFFQIFSVKLNRTPYIFKSNLKEHKKFHILVKTAFGYLYSLWSYVQIIVWPPRSPDLTVLDFYLWGRVKEIVFQTRPTTPENMMQRIQIAIANISRAEIEVAVLSTQRRINRCCIENNGMHFEHL